MFDDICWLCFALAAIAISSIVVLKKRSILVINSLHMSIDLRVMLSPSDYVHQVTVVCPTCHKHISVEEFSSFPEYNPDRPAIISLYVNGFQVSGFCITCREFTTFQKIVVGLDFKGRLVITCVKAPRTLQDHIKDLGWRFRGKYDGMKEVVVFSGLQFPVTGEV